MSCYSQCIAGDCMTVGSLVLCFAFCRCSFQGGEGGQRFSVGSLLRQEGASSVMSSRRHRTWGRDCFIESHQIFFCYEVVKLFCHYLGVWVGLRD